MCGSRPCGRSARLTANPHGRIRDRRVRHDQHGDAPREDGVYYNLECTCTGKLYLRRGADRHDREFLPKTAYAGIQRRPSLGTAPFGLREEPTAWELALDIPASTFELDSFAGLRGRGNFYKCGDRLPVPHYLSWAPIDTPKPDFHRPEYFEELIFV